MFPRILMVLAALSALTSRTFAAFINSSPSSSSPLDPSFYKDMNVSRGLVYHYYYSPPEAEKPVLLFLHGFPSTSYDWYHQITFFQSEGYGLIVPDMLGYGGTAKPLDPNLYKSSAISQDMVDLLDAENVTQAIVVGHDWGAKISARLANYHPDRFNAFGFLALGYLDPAELALNQDQLENITKQVLGYEQFGYWNFFSANGTDTLLEDHLDSFFDMIFTADPIQFITDFASTEVLQAWLEDNRTTVTTPAITPEDRAIMIGAMRSERLTAALNWYKILVLGIEREDDEGIPSENLSIKKPIFFGAALRDYICVAAIEISSIIQVSENFNTTTIQQYDTAHWVQFEGYDSLNADLLAWVESL